MSNTQISMIKIAVPNKFMAAQSVPPVAIRSSTTMASSPGSTAPTCISRQSLPYSKSYSCLKTLPVINNNDNKVEIDATIIIRSKTYKSYCGLQAQSKFEV